MICNLLDISRQFHVQSASSGKKCNWDGNEAKIIKYIVIVKNVVSNVLVAVTTFKLLLKKLAYLATISEVAITNSL